MNLGCGIPRTSLPYLFLALGRMCLEIIISLKSNNADKAKAKACKDNLEPDKKLKLCIRFLVFHSILILVPLNFPFFSLQT